jgi:hypothetical protein
VFDSTTQIVPGFLIGVVNGRSFHREGLELTSDLGGQLAIEASADLAGIEQFAAFSAGKAQRGDPARAGHEADHDIAITFPAFHLDPVFGAARVRRIGAL